MINNQHLIGLMIIHVCAYYAIVTQDTTGGWNLASVHLLCWASDFCVHLWESNICEGRRLASVRQGQLESMDSIESVFPLPFSRHESTTGGHWSLWRICCVALYVHMQEITLYIGTKERESSLTYISRSKM